MFFKIFTTLLLIIPTFGMMSTEKSIKSLENFLESFIGKQARDVLNTLGKPTKYYNTMDLPGQVSGTYMIYDYNVKKNKNCILILKYEKKTLKIIDWDYEGSECSRYVMY